MASAVPITETRPIKQLPLEPFFPAELRDQIEAMNAELTKVDAWRGEAARLAASAPALALAATTPEAAAEAMALPGRAQALMLAAAVVELRAGTGKAPLVKGMVRAFEDEANRAEAAASERAAEVKRRAVAAGFGSSATDLAFDDGEVKRHEARAKDLRLAASRWLNAAARDGVHEHEERRRQYLQWLITRAVAVDLQA